MHQGKLVFAQIMMHLPLTTFQRCVATHRGDYKVKDLTCLDQFIAMAFAQLTYRESLRDIEVSLRAQAKRLYHMGFRCAALSRNTLANANATHEVNVLDDLMIETGAYYLLDRGYLDNERLYAIHQAQAFFVTRTSQRKFRYEFRAKSA
jgi:hypothetical protein